MRFLTWSILGVLVAMLFGGCAGLLSSELRDGETMEKGKGEGKLQMLMVIDAAGLLRDSTFDGEEKMVAPAIGVSGHYGITDRIEVNGTAWTSTLILAPVSSFRTLDIGLRGEARVMITPRKWRHNSALGLAGWWHGGFNLIARFDDDLRYYGTAYGFNPSVTYSYRLTDVTDSPGIRSIYIGGQLNIVRADYTYGYSGGDTAESVTVRKYRGALFGGGFFLGFRTTTDFFMEFGASFFEHPESKKKHWIPALGISWRVGN